MRYLFLLALLSPFLLSAQVDPRPRSRERSDLNSTVELHNLTTVNTPALEFSPVFYSNGIVFVSSRRKEGPIDQQIGETFFELFYSELDPNGLPIRPESFSLRINSQLHEGPVSFNRDGDLMYFTRNNLQQGVQKADSKGKVGMKIYQASRGLFDWENVQELAFNSNEFSCMHPALSPDGNKLYFASNRPGGQGGLDIWVVFNQNGSWSEPVNMGSQVNTSGNEGFPFIHESGNLFFASDGHKGYGGLDLFMIDVGRPEWGDVINLGEPFNSEADDLGIILNPDGDIGYFSSDRAGGYGKDDLYMFEAPLGIQGVQFPKVSNIVIAVYDENSGRPLPGASIWVYEKTTTGTVKGVDLYDLELSPSDGKNNSKMIFRRTRKQEEELGEPRFVSNSSGEAYTLLNETGKYIILASKAGYTSREVEYVPENNIYNRPIEVGLSPSNCMTLSGLVASSPYDKHIPNAKVRMINQCTGEELEAQTNINGTFEYCIEIGCEFTVISELPGYRSDTTQVSTVNLRGKRSLAVVMKMAPESTSILRKPIQEGSVILLQNIHYDFGKSSIRKGEARDLEDLARLMKTYPSMEVELISHTDCRGSDEFNLRLSLDRAESAKQFLISRGVDRRRIKAFGYGEAYPANHCDCSAGVNCTEEEYEANRRTEVRIARMDEPLKKE
ncbi:MAG: PD40 domain-containing protein [Phaeodactylibacter sp.]|nr:PD40 domain-containing protein [Phaeodactylibacter sp.]MCB9292925.1 PD40 domain-containing protein [Lewinellaceae bacterium]